MTHEAECWPYRRWLYPGGIPRRTHVREQNCRRRFVLAPTPAPPTVSERDRKEDR